MLDTQILIIMQLRIKINQLAINQIKQKIYLMKNPTRYSKGGMLLDLQNQKSHYKTIMQPRKSMRISQQSGFKLNISMNQSKYQKNLRKSIQIQNQRLYKALYGIRNGKGIIEMMQQKALQQSKSNKKATLNNQYKLLEKRQQLRRGNERIVSKLCQVRPVIGSAQQWNEHTDTFQKNLRKISRATQNFFDAKDFKVDKNQQLKTLFRETIDFRRSRTSKDNVKRNLTNSKPKRKKFKNKDNKKTYNQTMEDLTQQQYGIIKKQIEDQKNDNKQQKLPKIQEQKIKSNPQKEQKRQ